MAALLGTPVLTGFVARALERFAHCLAAAGFDEAMTQAQRAEDVLCGDETPPTWFTKTQAPTANRCPSRPMRSPCAPLMRGWSGTRRSAPDPRPPSPLADVTVRMSR